MLFNSPEFFFLFLPSVVAGYFLLNAAGQVVPGKIWLLSASLFFYGYWKPEYLGLIILSILVNFSVGICISRLRRPATPSSSARVALGVGIFFNLGLLGYFKYADFFIANVNAMAGTHWPVLELVLPLAISFFTFQQIAYLVDTYQGKVEDSHFIDYCIFVTFFPQLIAGPIVHHRQMMPQFARLGTRQVNWETLCQGVFIFAMGLFKKVFIADSFAAFADQGYSAHESLGMMEAWATTLSYTLQLYYDFSAYSDMAIGAALMLNIRLPVNFDSPYKSFSIREFWRRWHISLSSWLRDYVYVPLGGNRLGVRRTYINLFLTFLLGGLWHGAGWTFVIWGCLHGLALMAHRAWMAAGLRLPASLAWLLTFLFVHLAWVFFRAESLQQAVSMLSIMFGAGSHGFAALPEGLGIGTGLLGTPPLYYLLGFGFVAFVLPNTLQVSGFLEYRGRFAYRRGWLSAMFVACALFFALVSATTNAPSAFLYFNF